MLQLWFLRPFFAHHTLPPRLIWASRFDHKPKFGPLPVSGPPLFGSTFVGIVQIFKKSLFAPPRFEPLFFLFGPVQIMKNKKVGRLLIGPARSAPVQFCNMEPHAIGVLGHHKYNELWMEIKPRRPWISHLHFRRLVGRRIGNTYAWISKLRIPGCHIIWIDDCHILMSRCHTTIGRRPNRENPKIAGLEQTMVENLSEPKKMNPKAETPKP